MDGWEGGEFTLFSDRDFPFSDRKFPFSDRKFPFEDTDIGSFVDVLNRRHLGGALMLAGAAVLVPGPLDLAAAGIGAAVGGPPGAAAGVVLYNLAGLSMIIVGAYLLGESIDYPDVHWDRAQMPHLGATPVVWGVPGYLEV